MIRPMLPKRLLTLRLPKQNNQEQKMNQILTVTLVILAAITLWAVLTPNHLYIG